MNKDIICVFQDCILCGNRGKKLKTFIKTNQLNVRKVSFASEEGKDLIHKAVFEHGIGSMPFFTDGTKFSVDIKDFLKTEEIKVKKQTKRTKKIKKELEVEYESDW